MTEMSSEALPHGGDDSPGKVWAQKAHSTREVEWTEHEAAELVNQFLAQFQNSALQRHEPEDIADIIRKQLYDFIPKPELDKFSPDELLMRQKLLKLTLDSTEVEIEALDQFATQDPIYAQLMQLTINTKAHARDFAMRRRALIGLQDFRLGTKTRTDGDISGRDEEWQKVINLLFPVQP